MTQRILHTSDLHLCSLGDDACHSLEALIDTAIRAKVDLTIVAGDLFDHNNVDGKLVRFTVEQLQRLKVPTVILPGNHDCLCPDSVYNRPDFSKGFADIHVFKAMDGETFVFPDLRVSVWGKPHVYLPDVDYEPLAGIPQRSREGKWHIAAAHGYYVSTKDDLLRSFQITHEQIVTSARDYVALGHCVAFTCICNEPVKAYYSGSASMCRTAALVDLVEQAGVQVTPCHL